MTEVPSSLHGVHIFLLTEQTLSMLCFLRIKVSAFSACRAFEERAFTADSTVVYLHKKVKMEK